MSVNFTFAVAGPWTVQFTDTTTPPATYWDWDFGDGFPHSFVQNPIHEYAHGPDHVYEVTLQTDQFAALVVSLMRFPDNVQADGATIQSLNVPGDEKGVVWTMYSHRSNSSAGNGIGVLSLEQYADPGGNPLGDSCVLASTDQPSFIADGDLTIEVTHNSVIPGNNYASGTALQILSAIASNFDTGPSTGGEWGLQFQSNVMLFTAKTGPLVGDFVQATINGINGYSPYPLGADNVLAMQRRNGLWEVWLAGVKVMHQFNPPNNVTTIEHITMGGSGTGCVFNNYGSGNFSKFRYTVGAARYTATYDPDVNFDTSTTLPVDVSGPVVPPEPALGKPLVPPLPTLPVARVVRVTPSYS